MSWLARSIANSLRIEDDDEPEQQEELAVDLNGGGQHPENGAILGFPRPDTDSESLDLEDVDLEDRDSDSNKLSEKDANRGNEDDDDDVRERGVKEDLSEFTETLTRQLWGVASFLAPPPPPPPPPPRRSTSVWEAEAVECSGSGDDDEGYYGNSHFREFSQDIGMPEEEEEEEEEEKREKVYEFEDAVGITDEVLEFAENTAHHPETWLNFPLSEEEEFEDFEISDSQHKHAQAIEHLAPRLAALRRELCPVHMTEGYFWMVYFVLLHSRLNKHDNDLLSTSQLVKARAIWMEELQKQTKQQSNWLGRHNLDLDENQDTSFEDRQRGYASHMAFPEDSRADSEAEQHRHENHEIQFSDKAVVEDDLKIKTGKEPLISSYSFKVPIEEYDEHEDDWVDDDSDLEGYVGTTNAYINEEDVSFSDLEDDLDYTMPAKPNVAAKD